MTLPFALGRSGQSVPRFAQQAVMSTGVDLIGRLLGQTSIDGATATLNFGGSVEDAGAAIVAAVGEQDPTDRTLTFDAKTRPTGRGTDVVIGAGDTADFAKPGGNLVIKPGQGSAPGEIQLCGGAASPPPSPGGGGQGGGSVPGGQIVKVDRNGDLVAPGGYRHPIAVWQLLDIPANRALAQVPLLGQADNFVVASCFRGSFVGLSVAANAPLTQGSIRVEPSIAGNAIAGSPLVVTLAVAGPTQFGAAALAKDSASFAIADRIGILVSSSADLLPAGSLDLAIVLWIED